jgi:hypothetical protein
MTITSPSGREYSWNKPTPPTQSDFARLKAYDESLGEKPASEKEPSASQIAGGIGLEAGLTIAGGALGTLAGPVYGTAAGAAIGGALGNYLNQKFIQDKETVSSGQVLASGAMSAIPASLFAKSVKAATSVGKVAAIRAGQGAGVGLGATVVEKAIDENRLPTATEAGLAIGGGALFGGVLGGLEKKYAMDGGLIANNFIAQGVQGTTALGVGAYAYNSAVERGDENPIPKAFAYAALTYAGTHLPSALAKMSKGEVLRKVAGPEAVLGKAMGPLRDAENAFKAMESDALAAGKVMKDFAMKQPNPNQVIADIFAVQEGKQSIDTLPSAIKEAYNSFEAKRAKATDDILLLYKSVLEPDQVAALTAGRTSYIRTTYAAHDPRAKVGVDYATAASSAKFKAELMSKGATDEEASATMNKMLKNVTDIYSPESFTKGTGPGSALREKGNLSQAAREFLGEVKDPFARVENTLLAQNRLIINEERDVAIRSILTESGIAKKTLTPEEIASGTFVKMVKGDEPTVHRSLSDLYVPNYVADAFREAISPNLIGDGAIAKSWMTLSGLSKMSKTVGNLAEAIPPQIFGNLFMAASAMKLNPYDIVNGIRMTMRSYGWSGKGLSMTARLKMNEELSEGRKYGILRGGVDSNELNTLISQSSDIVRKPKSVLEFMSKAYGFPDSAVRYSIWKQNIKELKEINWLATQPSGTGLDALKKHAAQITNDQFPTYELIPRRFRQASAIGVANTFGAFEYEVIRNSSNQLKYAINLINEGQKTGNYEMRAAGAKRLLAFSAVAGSTVGLSVAISRSNGIDAQRQKDLTNIMPSHSSNRANAFKMGKDGKFSYTPLNYMMPHANMTTAIMAGLQGGDSGAIIKSMMLGDDLGPFITPAIEGITNTYYGTKVAINEPRSNAALAERFAMKAFMPQFISGTVERIYKAKMGETNKLGNSPTGEDVMLRLAGYRQNTQLTVRSAAVRIRGISDSIADESSGYRRILRSSQETGRPIDEQTIYAERAMRYEQKQKELRTIFSSLSRLSKDNGFSEGDIIDAFKESGVPSRLIAGAVFGFITPMNRGLQQSNADIIREIMADPEASKNIKQSIIARAGGNKLMQLHLTEAYVSEAKSRARGVDPISSIFSGLSIGDGERANAIMRASAAMKDNPEAVKKMIDHFKKTRVITPEVAYQIKNAKP